MNRSGRLIWNENVTYRAEIVKVMPEHSDSQPISTSTLKTFLQDYPVLSSCLFEECDRDISKIKTVLEPLDYAHTRCQLTPYYIQAITTGQTTFLSTNLTPDQSNIRVSAASSSWLVGRGGSCAISILKPSVSRCHAVISHVKGEQFYIMDMDSSNGTRLNRRRIQTHNRHLLADGDLLEFGSIKLEFFIARSPNFGRTTTNAERYEELTLH